MSAVLQFNTHGNEKQKQAFRYLLGHPEITSVGYGGAAGGGKSYTIVSWLWIQCNQFPGVRCFIARNELKRLKESTLVSYFKFCADYKIPEEQRGLYNAQDSKIKFSNGSEILLLDASWMPSDPLYQRFGSLEFTMGAIDESAELTEQAITILSTRVGRHKNREYGLAPKILETFNPDRGHVYRRFYKPFKDSTLPEFRVFIPALATDNKLLEPAYIENLKRADEVTKQRLLYGNFDYDDSPGRLFDYNKLLALPTNPISYGEKWITVDVAREGEDKSVILYWDGYTVKECITINKCSLTELSERVAELGNKYRVPRARIIADESGVGGGVVDILKCTGFISNSRAIDYSKGPAYNKLNYENLKAQSVHRAGKAVNDNLVRWEADTVSYGKLVEELDSFVRIDIDKDGPFKIIKKQDQKEKLGHSPDYADCFIMRFMFEEGIDSTVLYRQTSTFDPILGFDPYSDGTENKKVYTIDYGLDEILL